MLRRNGLQRLMRLFNKDARRWAAVRKGFFVTFVTHPQPPLRLFEVDPRVRSVTLHKNFSNRAKSTDTRIVRFVTLRSDVQDVSEK